MNTLTVPDLDLVRAVPTCVRADRAEAEAGAMPTMVVRFSAFDRWYEIDSWWEGRFLERTARGAFTKTISENRANIKVLYDHGFDYQIGNKVLGTIEDLREDPDSPVGEVPLFDTSYNRDLLPGIEAGAYGSSFRMRVIKDEWNDEPGRSEHNPDGIPERTIKEVRLFEFGPVTWPANPDATAGVRGLTDTYYERLRSRDPNAVDELRGRIQTHRTPADRAAADGTAHRPGAAPDTDEPAARHSSGLTHAARRARLYPYLERKPS
ncbi:HK97 family phage prohead protease [Amycolatopsis roodepoortensis]|uniref:HK97 family phage prohead protease n=1 Tax=Amycolatopsis roodepoortensis TaxID=700274 RepID=UPI00214AE40A|nr:HK97 family phage prohead protease [Amycolatopsis roodepoortensis]UUV29135.1 HK97 family phage prohead protease [Amycolatopsis roodepoortensis]